MATNPYINQKFTPEQDLVSDLSKEVIRAMGQDMVFVPRSLVDLDNIFGEDETSKFIKS